MEGLREKILHQLKNTREYLSGEKISQSLGCSRMAVWKHIEELRKMGYRIESVHRKGYRLVSELDVIDSEAIEQQIETEEIGRKILYYSTLDSTQIRAHQLAKEGYPHGTVVIADKQTGGKGRLGRTWHSEAGLGIWASFLLRPNLPLQVAPQFTLLAAAAVARTLVQFGYDPQIKWPNDLLLNRKKLVGILTELQGDLDRVGYLIVGIGINVHHREEDFPPELRDKATSLYIENPDKTPTRTKLLLELCKQWEALYKLFVDHGFPPIKTIWESYALPMGNWLKISTLHGTIKGKAMGITDEGVLLVQDEKGSIQTIHSADIELDAQD